MEIKSDEFFINMKSLPQRGTKSFNDLVKWETEKCLGGITIQGVKIPGWLYWHTNLWNIRIDAIDDYGNITRIKSQPHLRDNEWERAEWLEKCRIQKKGYIEVGARQGGKSEVEASYTGYNATMFENSQNIIVGSNEGDLLLLTDKLNFGLSNMWEGLNRGLIDKDWSKKQVSLGYKDTDNKNFVWSQIIIRNTTGGTKTEVAAGTTAKGFVFDEIGKNAFSAVIEAAKPAFLSEFGWRVIPLLVGTGGSFENADDAKRYFFNPEANNFLGEKDDLGRESGLFLSGEYRQDCKYWGTLREYLNKIKGLNIPEGDLDNIKIKISDKQKAKELILKDRELKKRDPDQSELLKQVMYYPLDVHECFLSDSHNNFPQEACKETQEKLKDYTPEYVELYRKTDNKVAWRFSDKKPIHQFPVKPSDIKTAPVIIHEHPEINVPHGTYIIGIDPYNEDTSSDKINSLGCIEVYKRMYNPMGKMQNCIVATWAGRCKSVKEFHELCLMVAEYYNAREGVLPENEDKTLIQYFFLKKKGHFLADSFELSKQINPLTKSNRMKGLSAATSNQRHYMSLMVEDAKEETLIVDEEGNETVVMGVSKIPDPMLLEEMIQYKGKPSSSRGIHDGNYDRIIAHGHVLTLARYYDVKYPTTSWKVEKEEEMKTPPKIRFPWGNIETQHNPFKNVQHKPKGRSGSKQFI